MKTLFRAVAVVLAWTSICAWAGESVRIGDPWVRAAPPTVQTLAGYMELENSGSVDKIMTQVQSPQFAKVELHESVQNHDMVSMVPRKELVIAAGSKVSLKPGGYHLMLIAPKSPVTEGSKVALTLVFSDGMRQDVQATVRKSADDSPMQGHEGHGEHGQHHDMH
ncbi:MAG: copper chaperone PCu(A)C [Magnetococcales bacterium]|nr:copper chaperone PCu(A)C [Magnetococcales bacterium]